MTTSHNEEALTSGISSPVSTMSTKKMEDVRVGDRVLAARRRSVSFSRPLLMEDSNKSGFVPSTDHATGEFEYVYADVVYLPHGINNQERTTFTVVTTESGRDLKMTKNHMVPAGNCEDLTQPSMTSAPPPSPLVAASDIVVGDCVMTVTGYDKVVSVSDVEGKGVYTIITTEVSLTKHQPPSLTLTSTSSSAHLQTKAF